VWLAASGILAGAFASHPAVAGTSFTGNCRLEPGPKRVVVRIEDAETLVLDDQSEVRLIGALAPRAPDGADPDTPWPPERETVRALEEILASRSVELMYAGRRKDRYDRHLAQLFVESADGGRIWLQGHLISQGLARAYALPGNTGCISDLLALERSAREARRGLWAGAIYAVRDAANPRDLLARPNNFEIVEGRVVSVATKGTRTYLNFGSDWRRDFTVSVEARLARANSEKFQRLQTLAGRVVRVRGWIERRNGPLIEISDLEEIELIEAGAPGDSSKTNEKRPADVQPGAP
jgi:endonuclease YncB( thermonuclease family)